MKARIAKRLIEKNTRDEFIATYKGHTVHVEREIEPAGKQFYIIVHSPSGCYAYDGWWGECWNTMDEAVEEALKAARHPRSS